MIFSHGYVAAANWYTCYIKEFVSHGYIVFSIDHHDGSCGYTQLKNGSEKVMDTSTEIWVSEFKR